MSSILNEQKIEQICAARTNGASWKELKSQFGCSQGTIHRALFLGGVLVPGKGRTRTKRTPEMMDRICQLREEGKTYMEIAFLAGCSTSVVNTVLRERGYVGT